MIYNDGMRPVRASEIGSYVYCRRAWWYRQQGMVPANQAELAAGSSSHELHGRQVKAAGTARRLAYVLMLVAVLLFLIFCILVWIG